MKKKESKARIFLFQGEDDYTIQKKVREWEEAFAKKFGKHAITRIEITDTEDMKGELAAACTAGGLFSQRHLVVIKNLFRQKAETMELLPDLIDSLAGDIYLLFYENAPVKKNLKLYKKIAGLEKKGLAQIRDFEIPSGRMLNRFIEQYAAEKKIKISSSAAERLAVALGRDLQEKVKTADGYKYKQVYTLWQATSELDKLAAYRKGSTITPDDVDKLVVPAIPDNVFKLSEALGRKDVTLTQRYLNQLLTSSGATSAEMKAKPMMIVGALASQFRTLLQLLSAKKSASSKYEVASLLGWSSFRVDINDRILSYFSELDLKKILGMLLDIDKKLKSSTLPPKVLFANLINKI